MAKFQTQDCQSENNWRINEMDCKFDEIVMASSIPWTGSTNSDSLETG